MLVMGLLGRALDLFGAVRAEVSDLAEKAGRILRCVGRLAVSEMRMRARARVLGRR